MSAAYVEEDLRLQFISQINVQNENSQHSNTNDRDDDKNLSYLKGNTSEPLIHQTIGQLLEYSASKFANRVAVSFYKGQKLTYSEVLHRVEKLAAALLTLGLKKGEHVAIWGFNSIEWYLSFLAIIQAGLVAVNLNPLYEGPELEACLIKADVKAVIMDEKLKDRNFYEILQNVVPEVSDYEYCTRITTKKIPTLNFVIVLSEKLYRGTYRWNDLFKIPTQEEIALIKNLQNQINIYDACIIMFTSGTTNTPKSVLLTHFALVNNSYFTGKNLYLPEKEHISCIPVPLFHTFGTCAAILADIHFGVTLTLPSAKFSPTGMLNCIIDEKCTVLYGTPTMFNDLLNVVQKRADQDPQIHSKMANLERFFSGGAICLAELILKLKKYFKHVKFSSGYGMTEILSPFMSLPDDTDEKVLTTVGRIMSHEEMKVINTENEIVPLGEPGELCCRSYSLMKGYYNDPEKTKMSLKNGWFHTGDRFIFMEDGYAQIIGRIKDTIIRGGENIESKEIEEVIMRNPDVVNVQVYGVSCKRLGEVVAACVIKKEDSNLTADDIRKFCRGIIAPYKIPEHVLFLEEFPKTNTGKVQKFILKQITEEKLKANR